MRTKPSTSSRRTSAQWEKIVEQSETTALPRRAFCREIGVSVQSLYYWRSKLKVHAPRKPSGFTELNPVLGSAAPPPPPPVEGAMELRLTNGRIVRIMGGSVNVQALRTLIQLAEAGDPC